MDVEVSFLVSRNMKTGDVLEAFVLDNDTGEGCEASIMYPHELYKSASPEKLREIVKRHKPNCRDLAEKILLEETFTINCVDACCIPSIGDVVVSIETKNVSIT